MSESSLLGPTGSPFVELGGARAWKQRVIGDIVCSFQWLNLQPWADDEPNEPQACMVLFPAHRRMETGAKIITQKDAHMYATRDGSPTRVLIASAMDTAVTLGFDRNDRAAIMRIIDITIEAIPDLIAMPSDQPHDLEVKKAIQGIESTVRIGGQIAHQELR